jgi:NAD(P)-dependent dehydrogenase (short-subunit alcohol dehydrogenase family)
MRANGGGTIVNVTSGTGLVGVEVTPGITYGATKAALNRLSTLMARDLEPDSIAVMAVCPGYTRTALVEQTAAIANQDLSQAHPPSVPANTIADLIEADPQITTGRVFQTMAEGPPRLMADGRAPMPEGVPVDLFPREPGQ